MIAAEPQYRDWMVAALAGDATAYRRLLAALTGHLRAYYMRRVGFATAEELVQETLIAIHSRRATYDPGQPLTAWVYGIARYKLIDEFRRERRRASVPLEDAGELFAADESEALAARRDVEKLLSKLPEAKQRLVRAVKLEGASIAEVAARTGMSETAVKVGVHRAVKSLGDDIGVDRAELTIFSIRFPPIWRPPAAPSCRNGWARAWPQGMAATFLVLLSAPGLRPDIGTAIMGAAFWIKFTYTFALMALALVAGGAPIARIRRCATARWAAGCAGAAAGRHCGAAGQRTAGRLARPDDGAVGTGLLTADPGAVASHFCRCVVGDAHPGADASDAGRRVRGPAGGGCQRHTVLPALSGSGRALRPDLVFAGHSSGHGAGRCGGALGAALVAKPNLTGRC